MKKLRVLALMNDDKVPPDDVSAVSAEEFHFFKTDYDVLAALGKLGHEILKLGVRDELGPLRQVIEDAKPHIAFNLLEEFRDLAVFDVNLVCYLELMRTPYTGCNPRGMVLGRDKALQKKILSYHRIQVPEFAVVLRGHAVRRPRRLEFPVIVKSLIEEASAGIAQASVVYNDEALAERVRFVHESLGTAAILEQYIEGRELYVGVLGNQRLRPLPVWELFLDTLPPDVPRIATARVKWDIKYQDKHDIKSGQAKELQPELAQHIARTAKRIYRVLQLSGYARLDFRLSPDGRLYFLEANPNPDIARDEEFACSAEADGFSYEELIQKVLTLGRSWFARGGMS